MNLNVRWAVCHLQASLAIGVAVRGCNQQPKRLALSCEAGNLQFASLTFENALRGSAFTSPRYKSVVMIMNVSRANHPYQNCLLGRINQRRF